MSTDVKSGASADLLTLGVTSRAFNVTEFLKDSATMIYPTSAPKVYLTTTGIMNVSLLVAGDCMASLYTPSRDIYILRVYLITAYVGAADTAITYTDFGMARATGTAGGGSGTKATSAIGKRDTANSNSSCTLSYGPTAITGLTDDTAGDLSSAVYGHHFGQVGWFEMLPHFNVDEYLRNGLILPATNSLAIRLRTAAAATSIASVSFVWVE